MKETYQSGAISKHSTKQGNCLAGLETELCPSGGHGTQARAVLKLSFHSMGGDTEKLFSTALAEGCIITKKKKKFTQCLQYLRCYGTHAKVLKIVHTSNLINYFKVLNVNSSLHDDH